MKFGVYVIRDNASGESSLPFFAQTSAIAKRQFASQLRSIPPSIRSDFELLAIDVYDDDEMTFDNVSSVSSVSLGSDFDMIKICAQDADWFRQKMSIDNAPVTVATND